MGYGIVESIGRSTDDNPDPNFAYLQHLPVADQNSFVAAFGICNAQAVAEVGPYVTDGNEFDRLKAMQRTAAKEFAVDRRVANANGEWVHCMRADGWVFGRPGDPITAVELSFNQLNQFFKVAQPVADGQKAPVHGVFDPKIANAKSLKELGTLEIAVAKSDKSCMAKFIDKVYSAVRNDIESRLLAGGGP